MKKRFSVVEEHGVYFLYEGDQRYVTPCFFNIWSSDKGLVEAISRKIKEGKPNLVMLYLRKYDNEKLVDIIAELTAIDGFNFYHNCEIATNKKLCAKSFTNIQLRKLIDAYSECGSMNLAVHIAVNEADDSWDEAQYYYEDIRNCFDEYCCIDVEDELDLEYLDKLVSKYNAVLVPNDSSDFSALLQELNRYPWEEEPGYESHTDTKDPFAELIELGDKLLAGDGVEKDVAEAVKFYAMALAGDSMKKADVQQRFDEIRKAYGKVDLSKMMQHAIQEGDSESQYQLGVLHSNIIGEEFNKEEAFKWYMKSAENGYASAQAQVGKMYCMGEGGVEINVEEGKKWLNIAINQEDDLIARLTSKFTLTLIESEEEEAREAEEKAKAVAERMAALDEESLRKFEIVREFVSKHDDFWADFEDCDAVYRPFFHSGEPMRFWFYPPTGRYSVIGCESDKLILTKAGEICVENHFDGEFYNILDCLNEPLDDAVEAINNYNASI